MLRAHSTTLPLLVAAGALLLTATTSPAHEDPPGCFETGPAIVVSLFRADGVTVLAGSASECETINYRATLQKAVDSDTLCAFSGGAFTLTTPDGVVHDLDLNAPCVGGANPPCDPAVNAVVSDLIPYTIRVGDVIGGVALATANYVGGVAHDNDVDTVGVSAMTPKGVAVVRCDDGDACTQNVCDPSLRGSAACSNPPVDCDDANACTNDACSDGACTHVAPDPTCVPCQTAGDCNDGNACTTDLCTAGICAHETPDPTCVPCQTAGDCNDGNACTTDLCTAGICAHETPDPTCVPCETAGDCNDGNACTTDLCTAGICAHETPDPTCVPCQTAGDCNDGNACTTDLCTAGICAHETPDPTCVPCETAGDCNDGNACTTDLCTAGICAHETPDPTCVPCQTAGDCNDGNACTTDLCTAGICAHQTPDPTCVPCETAANCDDANVCTTDRCVAGICGHGAVPGCVRCETAAGCDDANACTTDTCAGGVCAHAPISGCPVEVCNDGIDNDGDGLVDCADTDCAQNPLCPTEICGNCIDDDGDGRVDYEDDDCCDDTASMVVGKMSVRTRPTAGRNKVRITARYAPTPPPGFDPGLQGTTLQLRDADGTFFCQTIPFKSDPLWTRMGVFKFTDPSGLMAAGLRRARFKILRKRGQRVTFRTNGRAMQFREPVGSDVLVTLRVGTKCTQANAALKTRKARTGKKLVFP